MRDTPYGKNAPVAVREQGETPRFLKVETPARLLGAVTALTRSELEELGSGTMAVISPDRYVDLLTQSFKASGIEHGLVYEGALSNQVTLVPVGLVKGLELDVAIVVEPNEIINGERNGIRSLYVALTRATRRLIVAHSGPLPDSLK